MTNDVYSKLEQLVDEEKMYHGTKIKITSFKEVNQTIVVKTNIRTLVFSHIEIDDFFKNLRDPEITNSPSINSSNNNLSVSINGYQPSEENKTLKQSLLDVLNEVKSNPNKKNRSKAKAVCEVANTMVNIQKAEVQMINAVKRT